MLVDIPKDVFQAQAHYTPVSSIHLPGYKVFTEGHTGQIRRAAQMIWEAQRPFVYAGGGIIAADASEELREFVELVDAPAVTTLMGLGALPSEHPNFISMPGMHGSYAANMGMTNADLLIALGVRFDDRVTGRLAAFAPHAKVIHVDIDPAEIGKNRAADLPIVGDVKRVLEKLNKVVQELAPQSRELNAAARADWWRQIRDWKSEHPLTPEVSTTEIKPQHLMREIDRLSGGRAIVTSDVGQHQMWAAQFIRFNSPRLWLNSGGLGSMGFGLPAAIGAQFARPDKLVFAIVGDGGFQMSIPELATIANHGAAHQDHRREQRLPGHGPAMAGAVLQQPALPGGARSGSPTPKNSPARMDSRAARSTDVHQLASALEEAVREPGPYLLNIRVSPTENVYPMVPAGGAINEMVLGAPATGGSVGTNDAANDFSVGGKQARRADAHHRPAERPRLQHRKPDRRPHAGSHALAHDHRGRHRAATALASDQADEQAGERAAGVRSHRFPGREARNGAAARARAAEPAAPRS